MDKGISPTWRPRVPLYPFEIVAWSTLLIAVVFLRSQGMRMDWVTVKYTVPPLIPAMGKYFLVGALAYSLYLLTRRRHLLPYWRRLFSLPWLILTLRLWLGIILFTYTYFWLKVCVPLVNYRILDPLLWRLDSILHGGFSPSLFLVELTRGTPMMGLLDRWYGLWLPSVSLGIAFFVASPGSRMRRRFVLSCVLIWVMGAWLYIAAPALGPIYAFPDVFQEVSAEMPAAHGGQQLLLDNYNRVLTGRTGVLKQFNPTRGIAAMPSLHVGAHWLLTLWLRRYARPLFVPALVGTGLTLLGSVVTGWHYAVDGYVGIALGQMSYWLAHRTERRPSESMVAV